MDLDHVALATRDARPALEVLVGELGATILFGGHSIGFRPVTARLGDTTGGMNVEILEPWEVARSDFLERFLVRHGDGTHHLTYKVDDLEAALDRVRAAGYRPVNVDRSDPDWKEAFLHPREAHGTVVQLAQPSGRFGPFDAAFRRARANGPHAHPQWWPDPAGKAVRVGFLRRVVLATPSLPAALGFFAGLLGGEEVAAATGWAELEWPGGGRVKLEHRAGAPPGVDRLEGDVNGDAAEYVVAGTRLVLEPR